MHQNIQDQQRVPLGDFPAERFEFRLLIDFRCIL